MDLEKEKMMDRVSYVIMSALLGWLFYFIISTLIYGVQ